MGLFGCLRLHDEAIRAHYAELKERARAAGQLLPGTPGSIVTHKVKSGSYISRAYYVASLKRVEDYIGPKVVSRKLVMKNNRLWRG